MQLVVLNCNDLIGRVLKSSYFWRHAAEDYIAAVAEAKCQGEDERAAQRMLKDFRTGALGRIALELPPVG